MIRFRTLRYLSVAACAVALSLVGPAEQSTVSAASTTLATNTSRLSIEMSDNGEFLAFIDGTDLKIYDFATGQTTVAATDAEETLVDERVSSNDSPGWLASYFYRNGVRVSPDSRFVLFTSSVTQTVWSYEVATATLTDLGRMFQISEIWAGHIQRIDLVELFDPASGRLLVDTPLDPSTTLPTVDMLAIDLDNPSASPVTVVSQRDPFWKENVSDGHVVTMFDGFDYSANPTDKPMVAYPVTGGPSVPIGDGRFQAVSDDYIIFSTLAGGVFVTSVAGAEAGSPPRLLASMENENFHGVIVGDRYISHDGNVNNSADRVDTVTVDDLATGSSWTVDVSALPGEVGAYDPVLTKDGTGVVFTLEGATAADSAWYHAGLTGPSGPVAPQVIPGTQGTYDESAVNTRGFELPRSSADGWVLVSGAVSGSGTSTQRDFRRWVPGATTSESIALSYRGNSIVARDWVVPALPGGAPSRSIVVSGSDGATRRVDLSSGVGAPQLVGSQAGTVVAAYESGDHLAYFTVGNTFDCDDELDTQQFCRGTLRVADLQTSGSSVSMLNQPERLMDTRAAGVTVDGAHRAQGALGSVTNDPFGNKVYRLRVAGRAGIPQGAEAALLNVVAINPTAGGFMTVFPCNGAVPTPPNSSSLNFLAGSRAVANNTNVGLDGGGDVCLHVSATSHVAVDVGGYFPAGASFVPLAPERFLDTRATAMQSAVVSGGRFGGGKNQALVELEVDIAGLGSVPADAAAVAMNLTGVRPPLNGFATVHPCDQAAPTASSLNFAADINAIANGVIIGLPQTGDPATDGKVCIVTSNPVDLLIDVTGYFPVSAGFTPTSPTRVLDTRVGGFTADGRESGDGEVSPIKVLSVSLAGRPGVPVGADSAVVNLTAVRPDMDASTGFTSNGFATLYPGPCGVPPGASTLNFLIGERARANGAIVSIPASGNVCIATSIEAHFILDVTGYFPS